MLNGVQLMDAAFLIVDATDKIVLQSQAMEHLTILMAMGVKNIVVIQNKIDLLQKKDIQKNAKKINQILNNSFNINPMIYPISAQFNIGTQPIIDLISSFNTKQNTDECCAILPIIRSFDINKPATNIDKLKGGVIGGGLLFGKLSKNTEILIIPGIIQNNKSLPFKTNINKIQSENTEINSIQTGSLVGIETNIDPYFTKNNGLVGQFAYYGVKENITIYKQIVCQIKGIKRIKKDVLYNIKNVKIHSINAIYDAKVIKYENKYLTLELEKPTFLLQNWFCSIFLFIKDKWTFSFISKIVNGITINVEIDNYNFPSLSKIPNKIICNEMPEFNEKLYKELLEKYSENKITQNKFTLKLPITKIIGNHTYLYNLDVIVEDICKKTGNTEEIGEVLKREMRVILGDFMESENIIKFFNKITLDKFTNFLKIFRQKYLECNTCLSHNTTYSKKNKLCLNCNKIHNLVK